VVPNSDKARLGPDSYISQEHLKNRKEHHMSSQQFNPAAVLGCSEGTYLYSRSTPGIYVSIRRRASGVKSIFGDVTIQDPLLFQRLVSIPGVTNNGYSSSNQMLRFRKEGDEFFLQLVSELYKAGMPLENALLEEQVRVYLGLAPRAVYEQAYQRWERYADEFLQTIAVLNLSALEKTKGIKTLLSPRRARGLAYKSAGVHVRPHRKDDRYVEVLLRGIYGEEAERVRDAAFDYFEAQGMRVLFGAL
jgi:hypothetical protein